MKKLFALALILAAAALCGCAVTSGGQSAEATPRPELTARMFESRDEAFARYDEVTFDDTLESLTERYGEPRIETDSNGSAYYWVDGDTGVVAVFFDNGRLRSKLVYFEDFRQFGKISDARNLAGVLNLSKSLKLSDVNLLLGGEGIEFIRVAQDSSLNPAFSVGYMWIDEKGQEVKILFNKSGGIDQVSYTLD